MELQIPPNLVGLTRKLAEFSVNLSLKTVPQRALENAKLAILDCFGVAVLAASQEIGEQLVRFAGKALGVLRSLPIRGMLPC